MATLILRASKGSPLTFAEVDANFTNLNIDIATIISGATLTNASIAVNAGIADTKLATISTAGKVSNSATTATSANTVSAIVARDGSGDFSAGTITADLTGTASAIANNSVTNVKVASNAAIAHSKLAGLSPGQLIIGNPQGVPTATNITGPVGITSTGLTTLGQSVVSANQIIGFAVTEGKINPGAVTETKIGTGAVTETKIGTDAVTEAKIGTDAVTEGKIGTGAVTEIKIGTNAVTETKIANAAVTLLKLSAGGGNADELLSTDGSQLVWVTRHQLTLGTSVASTSGTSIDFTGIPSWVKRVTVMFAGVSTNGTAHYLIQLGSGGVIQLTGYLGSSSTIAASSVASQTFTNGFGIRAGAATVAMHGSAVLAKVTGNQWICSAVWGRSDGAVTVTTAGSTTLSGTLDSVHVTTVGGTNTFNAGTVNILYEG